MGADDQAAIQSMDDNAFGDQSNTCGTNALSLTGINHDKFNSCLTGAIGISAACSECYAVTADYGFKNCKAACLLGWCKQGCLLHSTCPGRSSSMHWHSCWISFSLHGDRGVRANHDDLVGEPNLLFCFLEVSSFCGQTLHARCRPLWFVFSMM